MKQTDRQNIFDNANRIVLKIGSSLLTKNGKIDYKKMKKYARFVYQLIERRKEVILVTSGAVASSGFEHLISTNSIKIKQSLASVGQVALMSMYSRVFLHYHLKVGQILLSEFSISNRESYLNAKSTITTMLSLGVVPIINENDTVAIEELKFGDNDILGALVAGLLDADFYIILSDVPGFYTNYKKKNPVFHPYVEEVTKDHLKESGGPSAVGTGGMYTKLLAAKKCGEFSIPTLITHGNEKNLYLSVFEKGNGTLFNAKKNKPKSKKKWIGSQIEGRGVIKIDLGAEKALMTKKASLLSKGVFDVQGFFLAGDICSIVNKNDHVIAKGIVNFSSHELQQIKGKNSESIKQILGEVNKIEVVHIDNLFILDR